jgi:hypothetical protein
MKKIFVYIVAFSAVFLSCGGSAYQLVQLNAGERRISPSISLDKSSIITFVPSPKLDSAKFIYFVGATSNFEGNKYTAMMNDLFKQLGLSIVTQDQLIAKIADSKLDTIITNLQDKMQLRKLSKLIGPFLIVNTSCKVVGGSRFRHQVLIYDPEEPKMLLEIYHERTAWVSVKKEIVNPVLNKIIDWTEESRAASINK